MKALVISDLHIGPDGVAPVYAGRGRLPAQLAAHAPELVILNGDTFDLLLDAAPLRLRPETAAAAVTACATGEHGGELVAALAGVLGAGGAVWVRPGNHDLELSVPAAQEALRACFAAHGVPTDQVRFPDAAEPVVLELGAHRVLVTHGEHGDPFNQWRPADVLEAAATGGDFAYPPGSILVKEIMNHVKRDVPFIDLLKPDFHGAVLTALAVEPLAARALLTPAVLTVLRGTVDNLAAGALFAQPTGAADDGGFSLALVDAELDGGEVAELQSLLGDGGQAFGLVGQLASRLFAKLARAGLRAYARAHRWVAAAQGVEFFDETPDDGELREAGRLARAYGCRVVVSGHTHARRWSESPELTYVNTGTWMWLMRLPAPDASLERWADFLRELRRDPAGDLLRELRGSFCVLETRDRDLSVALERVDVADPGATGPK